ncbi:MAG: hypothetical protein DRO99_00525 [Candidatus Aenigmatarchaeota archaeon]|nr:MAG: hypothetical protein DRO99_00525 [Candidatus Aenigmarchaeota archaeon]
MKLPFGKKDKGGQRKGSPASGAKGKPSASSRVRTLSDKGLSEPEIIRNLRSEGYSPMEVDAAMKMALKNSAGTAEYGPQQPQYQQQYQQPDQGFDAPPAPPSSQDRRRIFPEDQGSPMPQQRGRESPSPPFSVNEMQRMEEQRGNNDFDLPDLPDPDQMPVEPSPNVEQDFKIPGLGDEGLPPVRGPRQTHKESSLETRRETEEMVEAMMEDKMDMFRKEVDNISDQMKRLEDKIDMLEDKFHRVDAKNKNEVEQIRSSINQYGESITEMSARMGSVEKVVKDSMTPMMQTLRSLSEAVKELRRK